jgi:L-seryl-tRNA(Ser) seleniumtransferase
LSLAALAAGREVIVSRGELVEIGGSFRLPEVMQTSGALLREVGTTNKTRLEDYRQAIGPTTAALLRVHPSNYRVVGFTERPDLDDLVALAHRHNLVLIDDIGSGALIDLTRFGLADEPLAATSIKAGADLVLFSGDKLLGGPQCGIIAGRQERVDEVARHPLFRALRVDKLTLAALGATLRLSRDPANAEQHVPLVRMLATSLENLQQRAARLAPQLSRSPLVASATVESCHSTLGGGSVPTQDIPSWAVVISPRDMTVDALAQRLRSADVPVVGRIADDRIWLDLRTVLPNQDVALVQVLESLDANSATAEREASGAAESTESGKLNKEAAG